MSLTFPVGVIAGVIADRIIPDPQNRWHPVAIFGRYAAMVEAKLYRPTKTAGTCYVAACVIPPVFGAWIVAKQFPQLATAAALWAALGGTTLERIGSDMANALAAHEIKTARELVPWLCSRDPAALDQAGMARATVESLAENTSDAAIAPLVWSIAGAPGVVLHRTVNTLDAMVGYKNERYQEFGWAAAKLDDLLAYLPARLTAVIHTGCAWWRGRGQAAIRAWREDAPRHPSPNAGPVEATAAAALGVQLGGETQYPHGVELRPVLAAGPAPRVETIRDAVRLAQVTQVAAVVISVLVTAAWGRVAQRLRW